MDFSTVEWPAALTSLRQEVLGLSDGVAFVEETPEHATLIMAIATREVLPILEVWLRHAKQVEGCDIAVVACDVDTANYLSSQAVRHCLLPVPEAKTLMKYTSATGFRARGLLATALKFPMVEAALRAYEIVVLSDIDALILDNPEPHFIRSADIAFQRDWIYPRPMVDAWGLAACTGFVSFRNTPRVKQFLASARAHNETYYSDQVAFNFALKDVDPHWDWPKNKAPTREQALFKATAAQDILGVAADQSLRLQALPADAFYRHHWIPCRSGRLVVYHPTLRKDVAHKARFLNDFSFMGHRYARFRNWMRRG